MQKMCRDTRNLGIFRECDIINIDINARHLCRCEKLVKKQEICLDRKNLH